MKQLFILFLLLPLSVLAEKGQIERVIDGDTVVVSINGEEERLRVVGIDTPETVKAGSPIECYGTEASNKAKEILSDKEVILDLQEDRDQYDRLLGYISVDGIDFGEKMITDGYAYAFRAFDHDRKNLYVKLEKQARDGKIGLWADDACTGESDSEASNIVYKEKINFWQNIFKTFFEVFKLII